MTVRRVWGVVLVGMCLGAVLVVVDLVVSWPPDLPWELVRYALVALWLVVLTRVVVRFLRSGQREAVAHDEEPQS